MVVARVTALLAALNAPIDSASLRVFRAAFGSLMVIAAARFFAHGWIDADYRVPHHFFHYWGFGWVRPLPLAAMYAVYAVTALAGLFVALGKYQRGAAAIFGVLFTYAHLIDKSNYLNHYYLVSLLALLLTIVPLDRRGPARAWMLWVFRFQIAVVYVFGGMGKIGSDWLLEGEPLRVWLAANAELPVLGRFFHYRGVALAFSWAGLLFDLGIVPLLLWRRTRVPAYALVIVFHVLTALLFHIGMFPWIMTAAATLFFDPSWPRRFWNPRDGDSSPEIGRSGLALFGIYAALQILLPLRHLLYPGNTLWTEEGFRFSWRVMLIEKSAELEYAVVDRSGRRTYVSPREYLTPFQTRMASTQPDMILELAHMIADDHRKDGPVQVFADAQVSFNGRMRGKMIDPNVDLAAETDTLEPKRWILPAPTSKPVF
jgi:hypothetical protein